MTLTIELTPEAQSRLQEAAARCGLSDAEYARRLLEHLLMQIRAADEQ